MHRRQFRKVSFSVLAAALTGACLGGLAPQPSQAATVDPATACANLANIDPIKFPVTPIQITLTKFNTATATLPDHCQVQGIINSRTGTDGLHYGDRFEVRLPTPAVWNGRFLFQGGGGSEGSVPAATGTAGSFSPALGHGFAVATQDGGHENSDLTNANIFYLESQALIDYSYHSIDVTAQTAKFLIHQYYKQKESFDYYYGCSTGGRQGMVFMQNFPGYFDGIVAGDPVYDLEAISLSEIWGVAAIKAITPQPIQKTASGLPILYPAFPVADQNLFESALLGACDHLDGVVDGVIDALAQCQATFNPSTYVFPSGQRLQCTGAKTASCLSKDQIDAVKTINRGPRSNGDVVYAPAGAAAQPHAPNRVAGYAYDGGYMTPSGIPTRKIGNSPTSAPGDYSLGLGTFFYSWTNPPQPGADALTFNFDTDLGTLLTSSPLATYSTNVNVDAFIRKGGKAIWYHGLSDPGPPVTGTINYYQKMADRLGGLDQAADFSRLYLVPNMGHCSGGPATDQFDLLTPLMNWVENGVAPGPVPASGTRFTSAPTSRTRLLCPYPQEARYVGAAGGDLSVSTNYACF
jgi:hypothetical protein